MTLKPFISSYLSLPCLAFLHLVLAPPAAQAGCERTIYNKTNKPFVAECKGCETPWKKTIPAGGSVKIEYTKGWDLASLDLSKTGERHSYRNPSSFGAWRKKNGEIQNYLLGEYGRDAVSFRLRIKLGGGQTESYGYSCGDYALGTYNFATHRFNAYSKGLKDLIGGFLYLHQPAHMDITILDGKGKNHSCYYLKKRLYSFSKTAKPLYHCACVDTDELKDYRADDAGGPCDQPGKIYPADSSATAKPANPDPVRLASQIAGTNWSHTLDGKYVTKFRFGKSPKIRTGHTTDKTPHTIVENGGLIEGVAPWAKVRWQAVNANTVHFTYPNGYRRTFIFSDANMFRDISPDGKNQGQGKRIRWLKPPPDIALHKKLVGTVWGLTPSQKPFQFRFGADGRLHGGSWDKRIGWKATKGNEVTLSGKGVGGTVYMKLHFPADGQFTTKGWNGRGWNVLGGVGIGRLLGKGPAPQHPLEIAACQQMSDTYAIFNKKGWGFAPTNIRHQWVAKKCKTIPKTALWPRLCQKLSTTYGISYQRSWGKADYSAKSTYTAMHCKSRPVTLTTWRPQPAPRPAARPPAVTKPWHNPVVSNRNTRPRPVARPKPWHNPVVSERNTRPRPAARPKPWHNPVVSNRNTRPARPVTARPNFPTHGGSGAGRPPVRPPVDGGCAMLAQTRSTGGGQSVSMSFVNKSGKRLNIQWITTSGGRKHYKTIAPEERYAISTSSHHPWLVSDMEGQCVSVVVPKAHVPQVVIR